MSDRDRIRMTAAEVEAFLTEEHLVTVATMGPSGRPHLMPLFYVAQGTDVLCFTYGASQKVRNLRRDPRATLQVEAGRRYDELRGVMMECDAELLVDHEDVLDVGLALARGTAQREALDAEAAGRAREVVARQATKRVAVRFRPTRIVSWDHRKAR
ncbi:MAG TPA: pyridoxamine 5'-phosphate oxidase family protein [Solirubrobacteraceae bacterium]|nr:pyridoxamine 5'-phosphate oxidase family protein [Solirubrobacteraceae bacterium]